MYTYSEDLFMTAFFTLMTRGVSAMVLVAGGGATPAGGVVPTTAMVTDPAAEAAGIVPISWRPGSGGEAGGLQTENVKQATILMYDNKAAYSYLEDLTSCAFHLCTTWRPCGTEGRVLVNSTDSTGELPLLTSPSASLSARGLPPLVDSLPGKASATRALLALAAALGRRWSG
jgi:hypothetical protein